MAGNGATMKLKKDRVQYEILYDRYNELYFMAKVVYINNYPSSWTRVDINGRTLNRLSGKIEECFKVYINSKKFKCITNTGRITRSRHVHSIYKRNE